MDKIWLIIKREYLTRVRKKSFIIMTLLGPLLIAGVIGLMTYLGMSDDGKQSILVVDEMAPIFDNLENGSNYTFNYIDGLSLEEAQKTFKDSEYTSILYIPRNIDKSDRAILYFKAQPSGRTIRSIENKVEKIVESMKLAKYKIDPDDYEKIRTNFNITSYKFNDEGKAEKVMSERTIVGFGFSVLIFFFVFMYGIQVMKGVIEEKTSRIVEVIITSVKPFQLMLGKILGIALVGLTQFLLWVALMVGLVSIGQTIVFDQKQNAAIEQMQEVQMQQMQQSGALQMEQKSNPFDISNPDNLINRIDWTLMIGLFIYYFLGGYLLYAALFASIGAAVDNETDSQQFLFPVMIPLYIGYFLSTMMIDNPDSPAAFWGSVIPFTSPVVMMVRVSMGVESSEYWELGLSMLLLVVGFLATTWFASKIYRVGILMYGKKVNYKEIWKWIRYQ